MYYQLHPDYGWRGWEKLPYALLNTKTGNAVFMNGTEYGAMSLCDGVMDVDSIFVTDQQREMIRIYEKKGFVVPCRQGTELTEEQRYRRYPARYIKMAHWSITGRCNYRCRHCYMSAPDAKYGELDHEACMTIIQELADCGVQNVSITGGEPLVRKDFFELVDAMLDRGLHIRVIYSNGKLVTDHFLDELTARGLCPEINMSFDGVGWCDWLRGVDGAEEAVKDAFQRCRDKGFPTAAEMCLHQYNKHTLRESINLLASLGCRHLKTNPVSAVGEWKRHGGGASLSMKEAFDLYLDYIPHFFEDGAPLSLMLGGFFMARKGSNTWQIPSKKLNGKEACNNLCVCGHARQVMYISADGRVLPCMALSGMDIQEQFPLVTEIGLAQCLTDSSFMDMINRRVKELIAVNPRCQDCDYKLICGGGCRASALEEGSDFLAYDPATCLIFKGQYEQKIKAALDQAHPRHEPVFNCKAQKGAKQ